MKNSRLFDLHQTEKVHEEVMGLITGSRVRGNGVPMKAAWSIEEEALARGWHPGEIIGNEETIRANLGVGRETVREAIKIVESRGALEMKRGRQGGLQVNKPDLEDLAAFFARYLIFATEGSPINAGFGAGLDDIIVRRTLQSGQLNQQRQPGESVRSWLARSLNILPLHLYARLYDHLSLFFGTDAGAQSRPSHEIEDAVQCAVDENDAAALSRLIDSRTVAFADPYKPQAEPFANRSSAIFDAIIRRIRAGDRVLGSEADLCEQYDASRSSIRQALRMLCDLDLVEARRGRSGGYSVRQPSSVGVIRRAFAHFAAENLSSDELVQFMWDLNVASLGLGISRLAQDSPKRRKEACDAIRALTKCGQYPDRFILLLSAISKLASCPVADTLAESLFSFQMRRGDLESFRVVEWPKQTCQDAEEALISAIESLDILAAESCMSQMRQMMAAAIGQASPTPEGR